MDVKVYRRKGIREAAAKKGEFVSSTDKE